MGENMNPYRVLVRKPEGKKPLRRPRRSRVDNIKMDFRELEWNAVDWIDPVEEREQWRTLVYSVMKFRVP
jgi:hypothetical protein